VRSGSDLKLDGTLERRVVEAYVGACHGTEGPGRAFDAALRLFLAEHGGAIEMQEAKRAVATILATFDGTG
jgi:hypothetical protein